MSKTEVEKFLEGVKSDEQIDLEAKPEVTPEKKEDDPEKVSDSIKNRQHRRLEQRLQAERETNIALNERIKAYETFKSNVVKEVPIDDRIARIFGNTTPDQIELGKHFTEILNDYKGKAREEAINDLKTELARQKREEVEAINSYESKIESGLESIEDTYNVDLTSQASEKERKAFLEFVTKIAPKDEGGSPSELPDLVGAYEVYKSTQKPKENARRTEIAARSMQQSGQANLQQEQISEEERWLVNNGIIKPRKR